MPLELYSEQDAETLVVVPALRNLGYDETRQHNVALRFQNPITVQQGRERRTIYADIVVYVNNTPVIVVDAKNPRQYLSENDREQVVSYGRLIGSVAPYSVLCNGHTWQIFDTVTKQQLQHLPRYEDLLRDLQQRRLSVRQRSTLQAQATRTLFAIDSARELSRIMRRCHDVIRNLRGYDPTKAFDELSKLLFAKMYEEREVVEGRRANSRFTLASIREMRGQGVEIIQTLWRDTASSERYRDVFSDQDAEAPIDLPPEAIDAIVAILEDKDLGLTNLDVKGVAFEEFLASTYRGGGLGQYFTPREVVNFMVDLVDPTIGERAVDPACGTGGFLIRVYDVVSEKIRASELRDNEKTVRLQELANECLAGIDWEPRAARTCKMNMIIHGDGHAGVYQANGLDLQEIAEKARERQRFNPNAPSVQEGTFDIVLTNPPFGAVDKSPRILEPYELGRGHSQKREVLMLERCIRLLRPGGRMAVVIPEGILSNKLDQRIRNFIRRECIIKAIIRLPQDAFQMSQGAACTSILYAIKKDPDNPNLRDQGDIFFARAEYIGISPSGRPIAQNDLLAIKEHYHRFEEGNWNGIELRSLDPENVEIVRSVPGEGGDLWLEPEVNRTSLLYDRLSYVVRVPQILDRFSYTYFHPRYFEILNELSQMPADTVALETLCVEGYPTRGKKPNEESAEGIPILKVRNVTGAGIDLDTEYAPDSQGIRQDCARAIVSKDDILITSTGEGTIGRVDIYPYGDDAIADGHVCICRLRPGINLQYILEYLRSEHGQIQMLRHVSGSTGQTELLKDHVSSLLIPFPDAQVQEEVVRIMQEARATVEQLREQAHQLSLESANQLAAARRRVIQRLM
jgi:type I restriction-modification system DNA methylase subunit